VQHAVADQQVEILVDMEQRVAELPGADREGGGEQQAAG